MRFAGDVSRVFLATVLHGLGTKPAGVLHFLHALPKDLFLGFCRSVGDVLDVLLSFSSAFRRRRFESFSGYGFARLRHETCWGSAFSHALPKDLFVGFCLVACRLPVFLFLFSGFQRQRFGNFSGCSFAMA